MSSKNRMNVRPRRAAGATLVETAARGTGPGVDLGASGSTTASKVVMVWGAPSSLTRKSSLVRPDTGWPFLSRTTTSTVTASIWDGKAGAWARTRGVKAGDAPRAAHSAADTARFMAEQYKPGPPGPDPRAVTWMSLAAEPLAPYDARWRTSMTFSPSS